jgi:hypothetical protein
MAVEYKTKGLFKSLRAELSRQGCDDRIFDPIAEAVIDYLLNSKYENATAPISVSSYTIANMIGTARSTVNRRIKTLATFALVTVQNSWRSDGTARRKPMQMKLNPMLVAITRPGTKASMKLAGVKEFVRVGIRRMEVADEVLQGFTGDVLFGTPETDNPFTTEKAELKLTDVISAEDQKKAEKQRQNLEWRKHDEKFVAACANVWVFGQGQMGYGFARPNWEGKMDALSPTAKKERRELTKIFQQYGCRVAACAWYIFIGGTAELDDKGRPVFNLSKPHQQYVSEDKKPSQFSKHFNSVINDDDFINLVTNLWGKHEPLFQSYYKEVFEVGPREGDEYSKTKIVFGRPLSVHDPRKKETL